jgi:hypothetical protein
MGFFDATVPNVTSLAEGEDTLIFPADSSIQKEIPLYLKMTCVEYSVAPLARKGGISTDSTAGIGNVKAYIYVPVPSKLVTQTAMRYKQEENELIVQQGSEQQAFEEFIARKTVSVPSTALEPILPGVLKPYAPVIAKRIARSVSSMIDTDFTETILQSGSKRGFTISMYLPCLNLADSLAAAKISRALEALALPTMDALSVLGGYAGVQMHFHPPMWFFGIGRLNGTRTDIDWTSQPQASVLTNVAVTRTAIDASSFTALDGNIKPVAYSITLQFQEIETAFRVPGGEKQTSYRITNRSGAFAKGGLTTLPFGFGGIG